MQVQVSLPETSFDKVIERIFATRRITREDQSRFMAALLSKNSLSDSEQDQINRVFDGLSRGLLKVVE
jgi:hypothetical protein